MSLLAVAARSEITQGDRAERSEEEGVERLDSPFLISIVIYNYMLHDMICYIMLHLYQKHVSSTCIIIYLCILLFLFLILLQQD